MSFVYIVDLNICIMLFVTCEYNVFNYMNYVVTFKIMNLNLNLVLGSSDLGPIDRSAIKHKPSSIGPSGKV